jgi:hypothetical protein
MKLGLLKFCIPIDFSVLDSVSNSGVDDRYGFIKELVDRGHQVTVFSPLVRGTKNNPREARWIEDYDENDLPEHIRWIKKIKYCPRELPVGKNKMDVLIAEAGVGNIEFINIYRDEEDDRCEHSLIRRFMHVINAHKGPVFYLHNDPSLPFYFRQLAGRKYPWGHKKNGYTNPIEANRGEGWVRDSGWGTFDETFKDKTSIVLTRALPESFEFMLDTFNADRCGYKEFSNNLKFEYTPPAYDYSFCKEFKFQSDVKYPLFYSGGDRRRRISFRKFYEDMDIPTYVSGKWEEEVMSNYDGISFLGWIENRYELLKLMNQSGAVIQIQPKDASHMGWWTARPMEAPACYSMAFMDGLIKNASDMVFDSWFVLKGKYDGMNKIRTYLSMSNTDRFKIIESQRAYCQTNFTWKRFTDNFILLCNKYLSEHKVKFDKKLPYDNMLASIDSELCKPVVNEGFVVIDRLIEEARLRDIEDKRIAEERRIAALAQEQLEQSMPVVENIQQVKNDSVELITKPITALPVAAVVGLAFMDIPSEVFRSK